MDAKAKVVSIQRYTPALNESEYMDGTTVASMDPYTEGKFVLFIDHEAALAELREQLERAKLFIGEAMLRDIDHQTLITGLEALAGELEALMIEFTMGGMGEYYVPPSNRGRPKEKPGFSPEFPTSMAAWLIKFRRTLTNSAKSESTEVLK